jgi:hypothetical protein
MVQFVGMSDDLSYGVLIHNCFILFMAKIKLSSGVFFSGQKFLCLWSLLFTLLLLFWFRSWNLVMHCGYEVEGGSIKEYNCAKNM